MAFGPGFALISCITGSSHCTSINFTFHGCKKFATHSSRIVHESQIQNDTKCFINFTAKHYTDKNFYLLPI